jgi:hypothetical protein
MDGYFLRFCKFFNIRRVICQAFDKVPMVLMPVDMVSLVPGML